MLYIFLKLNKIIIIVIFIIIIIIIIVLLSAEYFITKKKPYFGLLHHFFAILVSYSTTITSVNILQFCIHSYFRMLDSFSLCCYATRVLKHVDCEYPLSAQDSFSSCNRMIEDSGPRKIIWLLGVLAVLGNLAVIAWRLIRRDDHPVQTCLLTNLAVSDFLMGVYLMIVAIQDQIWAGMGFDHQRFGGSNTNSILLTEHLS